MERLQRLAAMALFLGARRRVLAREVAERFDVSLRTVYRDVSALMAAGFPVTGNAGDGYRMAQESFLRPLALSPDEAEALAMAAQALGASVQSPMREALVRATIKLEAVLDVATRRRVFELQKHIVVPDFVRRDAVPTPEILECLRECRVAHIDYRDPKSGQRTTRDIEPLGLVCLGAAWWLIAYCRLRRDARGFRVDGITEWVSTEVVFTPRAGFSLGEIIARDRHLAEGLFGC